MRVHVTSGHSSAEVVAQLSDLVADPEALRIVFAFYGCGADDMRLHLALRARFPRAALIGGSSSGGVMTQQGFSGGSAIGLMAIEDAEGEYGSAGSLLGTDPAAAAEAALAAALDQAGCPGELPELIWIYQSPGHEEQVLEGLRRTVGDRCPIIGGSSADDDVSGRWRQFGPEGPMRDSVVVAVLFPSRPVRFAFQGGYEPVGLSGLITGIGFQPEGPNGVVTATSGREILSIDGQPAATVYNRWLDGRLESQVSAGGTILADTTLFPLAISVGQVDGISHYLLVHPESLTADGSMRTFCNLQVGDRLYAMRGDRQRLVDRAGRLTELAAQGLPAGSSPVGALLVYCGGCKMAVGEDIGRVADSVRQSLAGAPFVGCFTFGEQGRLLEQNRHGNLMISAVVFGG